MGLQWTLIALFLYTEMGFCVILMLPFISPGRWQKILRSRIFGVVRSHANIYFNIFMVVLVLLFIESIRELRKYGAQKEEAEINPNPLGENKVYMRLFRAERNFHITLFALFLFVVLRKLVTLISSQATLEADNLAIAKQAENLSTMAEKLLDEKKANKESEEQENKANNETEEREELKIARREIDELKADLSRAVKDKEAIKSQAESTTKEYDRLLEECSALQEQIETLKGEQPSKKDA